MVEEDSVNVINIHVARRINLLELRSDHEEGGRSGMVFLSV